MPREPAAAASAATSSTARLGVGMGVGHRPAPRRRGSAARRRPGWRSPRRTPGACAACRGAGRRRPSPAGRRAPANRRAASRPRPATRAAQLRSTLNSAAAFHHQEARAAACRRRASRSASPRSAAPRRFRPAAAAHPAPLPLRRRRGRARSARAVGPVMAQRLACPVGRAQRKRAVGAGHDRLHALLGLGQFGLAMAAQPRAALVGG